MLFLDTHLQDLQARSVWGKDSTVKSINKIASDSTMYTTFYNLNYSHWQEKLKEAEKIPDRY